MDFPRLPCPFSATSPVEARQRARPGRFFEYFGANPRAAFNWFHPRLFAWFGGRSGDVWSFFRRYSRAVVSILQSVPPIAWVPLFIILLGFGDYPIILVILIAAFFPMAVSVMNAVE
jgi:NitT/TauT family transport system permease protein